MQVQNQPIQPSYSDDLTRSIGALQYLQVMITVQHDPTLTTVAKFVESMQCEFGAEETLENVIQTLVARHLTVQLAQRRRSRSLVAAEVER